MEATPHTIKVLQSWAGIKFARAYWCPIRQTFILEGNTVQTNNQLHCIECGKRVKQ